MDFQQVITCRTRKFYRTRNNFTNKVINKEIAYSPKYLSNNETRLLAGGSLA